jgi:hypothetical protein
MSDDIKDQILRKMLADKVEDELSGIGEMLTLFIENYQFLFKGERENTLKVLQSSFLQNYDQELNKFKFDFDVMIKHIDVDVKEEIFNNVISNFSKTVSIDDIKPKS